MQLLLLKEVDINLCDHYKETPLHKASKWGHESIVKFLLSKGANVNVCNWFKETIPYKASERGYDSIVQFLLRNGANVNLCNLFQETPLRKTKQKGHKRLCTFFLVMQQTSINVVNFTQHYNKLNILSNMYPLKSIKRAIYIGGWLMSTIEILMNNVTELRLSESAWVDIKLYIIYL